MPPVMETPDSTRSSLSMYYLPVLICPQCVLVFLNLFPYNLPDVPLFFSSFEADAFSFPSDRFYPVS